MVEYLWCVDLVCLLFWKIGNDLYMGIMIKFEFILNLRLFWRKEVLVEEWKSERFKVFFFLKV